MVHADRNLTALQYVGEVQVSGSIVDRISAEDDQQIDLACLHVGDKIFKRLGLVDWVGVDRIAVEDGLADVAEFVVQRMRERMYERRRLTAHQHNARASVRR